jgi:hypothetical protein
MAAIAAPAAGVGTLPKARYSPKTTRRVVARRRTLYMGTVK